jgi:prolyl-tRNA synthetase
LLCEGRLVAAVVEQHHDADGIIWPRAIAPFGATVLTLGGEPELKSVAKEVIEQLVRAGLDVLYDDRDERAGAKFKDADLIGTPLRIGVGRRGLIHGTLAWKWRESRQVEVVRINELAERAR